MTIEQISYYANLVSSGVLVFAWLVFGGTILPRKRRDSVPHAKRAPASWIGFFLQGVGFGIVWGAGRTPFASPFSRGQFAANIALQAISIVLAVLSAWLAYSAIRELGKQWSLQARLIEDHKLVTTGVYGVVRHPIYTAILGMLIATGLAFSHWLAVAPAVIVFLIGTKIRTYIEEGLLRDAFGEEFEKWRAKVPGLIPFVKI